MLFDNLHNLKKHNIIQILSSLHYLIVFLIFYLEDVHTQNSKAKNKTDACKMNQL